MADHTSGGLLLFQLRLHDCILHLYVPARRQTPVLNGWNAGFMYPTVFLENPVFFITVLVTSVMHCSPTNPRSFTTTWNKVDFPIKDGPMK